MALAFAPLGVFANRKFFLDITKGLIERSARYANNRITRKKNYMTVPAALKELDKIEMVRQADGVYCMDHAVTATQKDILHAFNMTATTVKNEAAEISKQLARLTN